MTEPWFEIKSVLLRGPILVITHASYLSPKEVRALSQGFPEHGRGGKRQTDSIQRPCLILPPYNLRSLRAGLCLPVFTSPLCFHPVHDTGPWHTLELTFEWMNKAMFESTFAVWLWADWACFIKWDLGSFSHRSAGRGVSVHICRWVLGALPVTCVNVPECVVYKFLKS